MSAMVMPDLMPSRRYDLDRFNRRRRALFHCAKTGLIISATGRSGFGKAEAGAPASAMNSRAEPDIVSKGCKDGGNYH
jgi:hypothetical protein